MPLFNKRTITENYDDTFDNFVKNNNNEIKTLTQTAGPAGATLLATAAPLCTIGGPISVGAGLNYVVHE